MSPRRARPGRTRIAAVAAAAIALGGTLAGCGKRGDPEPPESAVPEAIDDLVAASVDGTVRLTWSAPQQNLDGSSPPELVGFQVLHSFRPFGITDATPTPAELRRLALRWREGDNRTAQARLTVDHRGGRTTLDLDQRRVGRLWFDALGYLDVYTRMLGVRIGLWVGGFLLGRSAGAVIDADRDDGVVARCVLHAQGFVDALQQSFERDGGRSGRTHTRLPTAQQPSRSDRSSQRRQPAAWELPAHLLARPPTGVRGRIDGVGLLVAMLVLVFVIPVAVLVLVG